MESMLDRRRWPYSFESNGPIGTSATLGSATYCNASSLTQPHRFDQMVIRIRGLAPHFLNVESLGDIECHQRGNALPIRRTLPNVHTSVIHADSFIPVRMVRGDIVFGQPPALLLDVSRYLLADIAFVVRLASAFGDDLQ